MGPLLKEIRHKTRHWLLVFVPVLFIATQESLPVGVALATLAGVTVVVALVTNSGRSAWFVGALLLMEYAIFAVALYLRPPQVV